MNNLSLKVSADIADAQAKLSVLNAEFRGTQTQINALARAGAAGNLDSAGAQELQALTTRSLELQAAAAPLAATVDKAGFAVKGLGAAALSAGASAESAGVNVSSLTRFSRELFDEFSSGRTRYVPSTLAELANQGFHLKPAMLAGYGGVAILVAGLGYLTYKSIEAQEQLKSLSASAAFLGNVNVSQDFAGQLVSQIKTSADVGEEEAQKTARAIASIQNISTASMSAIAGNIGVVAQALGTTSDKAADTVAKILDVNTSVDKLQELLPGLSAAQVEQAQATQQGGNYADILRERWSLLTTQLQRMQETTRQQIQAQLALREANSAASSSVGIGMQEQAGAAARASIELLQRQAEQIQRNIALTKQMSAQPIGPQAAQNQLKAALEAAEKLDEKDTERRQIAGQIATMEQAILHANQEQRAELEAGINAASLKLAQLNKPKRTGDDGAEQARIEALQRLGDAHQQEAQKEISDYQRVLSQLLEVQNAEAESAQNVLQIRVQTAEQALDAAVSAGRLSAAQRLAVEQQLTQALYEQDLKRLQNQLATLQPGTAAYAQVAGQIEALQAQQYQRIEQLNEQAAQSAQKSSQKQVEAYQKALAPISNAISTSLNGVIMGTQTWQRSVAHVLDSVVEKYISAGVKTSVNWLAQETQKTVATMSGEQARTAATVTGNAARTASTASAAATQKGVSAAAGASTVQADAAKAFSGTYASVAQIPYVGWIMAPIAASGAYAAVMAYEGLASLAVGTFEVPQDMMANIHRGEMVVPRNFADGIRSAMSGAGGGSGEIHYHHHGDVNVADSDVLEALDNPQGRNRLIGIVGEGLNRGVRP